jgi:hypothetical protein
MEQTECETCQIKGSVHECIGLKENTREEVKIVFKDICESCGEIDGIHECIPIPIPISLLHPLRDLLK